VPFGGEPPLDATPADLDDEALGEDAAAPGLVPAPGLAADAELVPGTEAAAPTPDQIAAAAEVLVTVRTRRQLAAAITWNAMIAIALILTIASIILIIAGALGADL
jgi:hypothetical protein